jgi:hypothetical protein
MLCESTFQIPADQAPLSNVLDETNLNLTRAQRELLLWHNRLDHASGLKQLGMDLEEEDDVAGFLGVLIQRHTNGTIELLQTGLIRRIIDALQITHLHAKRTPAKGGVLGNDRNGVPSNGTFNYASVLGMLGYLQANSRPDITFAVSQ